MRIYNAFPILLLFISASSVAQRNYVPGIIITTQGDTLKGLIDYRDWTMNPEQIHYKKYVSGTEEIFGISQVRSFEIPGKDHYEGWVVSKDIQPVDLNKLESGDKAMIVKSGNFLRVLVKGDKLSLYQLVDEKEHFFIREGTDTLQELKYKVFKDPDHPATIITLNIFRDQLKKYSFSKNVTERTVFKIENALYKENELVKIITLLNSRVDYSSKMALKGQKTFSFFGGGGISYNGLSFSGNDKTLNVLSFPSAAGYQISTGVDAFARKGAQKLFLRFEASYRIRSFKGKATTDGFFPGEKEDRTYEIRVSSLNTSLSVLYTFLRTGNSKLFGGIGSGINFSSYPENTYTVINRTIAVTTVTKDYRDFDKKWAEFFFRAGFLFNHHLEAGAMTKIAGGFSPSNDVKTKAPTSYFSLLYHF